MKTDIEEKVYGDLFVRLAYGGSVGHSLVYSRYSQKFWSHLIGYFQSLSRSKRNISSFVKDYEVEMAEFIVPDGGYRTFNDFFIRPFRVGARAFPADPNGLGSPAEGRLSVFEIESAQSLLSIKGELMSMERLLGSKTEVQSFLQGYSFVFRLCPVDYHRYHFPDSGVPSPSHRLGRTLHSVNPMAQRKIPDVFLSNERQVSFFESTHFGRLAFIEVGALGVGKIHQTYKAGDRVERGAEKGYFSFGGSTVIMLTQQGKVQVSPDLLEKSHEGIESLVRLGECLGNS